MTWDIEPKLGRQKLGAARLLLVCYFDPNGISTIYENIAYWQRFSEYSIEILNLWPNRSGPLSLSSSVDLSDFDGIIIHCTTSYSPTNLRSLDRELPRPFEQYDGLKILMKQDEQVHTSCFSEYIAEKKFDLVITCVPPQELEKVYPTSVVGDVTFLHALTGYVSPYMLGLDRGATSSRKIEISYRGSIQPLEFGRLGFEKRKISYDVAHAATGFPDLRVDISSRWEDRIAGPAWFDFLGNSKAVLGVESGSNLFDFTGEVATWCRLFEAQHSECSHLSEAFYQKAHAEYLHRFEGNVNYAQISPRHFEAAATRSAQILYEGHYSGIFLPNVHFFPLRRDLSNFSEAVDFIRDDKKVGEFSDRTYEEIVLNRQYSYERFVASFDRALETAFNKKSPQSAVRKRSRTPSNRPRALVLAAHNPTLDPRIGWMSDGLAADFQVCELGTSRVKGDKPSWEQVSDHVTRVRVEPDRHDWDWVLTAPHLGAEAPIGLETLRMLYAFSELPSRALVRTIGALDHVDADLQRFRKHCRNFVVNSGALIQAARLIGQFDVIVASDLNTLPAGLALGEEYDATVVYDAHEYWPFSDIGARHWAVSFWQELERALAPRAQLRISVSSHLAECMSKSYDCEFLVVPNCTPLGTDLDESALEDALSSLDQREEMRFLFQGRFAPGRGLEGLVKSWAGVDSRARLLLRGPDSQHKEKIIKLAQSQGLLNKTVFFPEAVAEDDLVRAGRDAEVALIPYSPANIVYRYCCPNKLSQYMAAGLPILFSENLSFVKSIVTRHDIGKAVDFEDQSSLASAVIEYIEDREKLAETSRRSLEAFRSSFNWQTVTHDLYTRLGSVARKQADDRLPLDYTWIDRGHEMAGAMYHRDIDVLRAEQKAKLANQAKRIAAYQRKIAEWQGRSVIERIARRAIDKFTIFLKRGIRVLKGPS
jgi:glycosyltransferase involved in cell wall biosynthesis